MSRMCLSTRFKYASMPHLTVVHKGKMGFDNDFVKSPPPWAHLIRYPCLSLFMLWDLTNFEFLQHQNSTAGAIGIKFSSIAPLYARCGIVGLNTEGTLRLCDSWQGLFELPTQHNKTY